MTPQVSGFDRTESPLAELRRARGLSQEQLASLAGVSVKTVSRAENDHVRPHRGTLVLLARALSLDPSTLSRSSCVRQTVQGLSAAVRTSAELELIRDRQLERAVAETPGATDWEDLTAAWGALPRGTQAAIVDTVDDDLRELTQLCARQAIVACDAFGVRVTVSAVAVLVALEIQRRELRSPGAETLDPQPVGEEGSNA